MTRYPNRMKVRDLSLLAVKRRSSSVPSCSRFKLLSSSTLPLLDTRLWSAMVLPVLVSFITASVVLADTTPQESKGACALQTKMKKGGSATVLCSLHEIMCHDSATMTDSCYPKSTGCPVTCAAGDHVCHTPPPCETCDGYNWCSSATCPVTCSMHEIMCHDFTTMTDSCQPKAQGCPVTCAAGEHVCHTPPPCENCDGYNWCSSHTCPVTCAMDQVMCHDSMTMTDSCHPKSAGCPVTCGASDHVCHSPPTCEDCHAYNWCSSSPCPVYCAMDEVMCHDSMTMTDSCHPASMGCPVTCPAGEHTCHVPPACDTCSGYSYCSSHSCPVYCTSEEVYCHDSTTMTDSCHPKSTGCPITCPAGEHVCTSPPACDDCEAYNWCSAYSCPVYCAADEVMCHDSMTMTDSCHPKSTGCPITCAAGEHVCHSPPPCESCDGYSWCSTYSCPVYCAMDEVMCHDSMTMTDSCHPKSTGCPVTCAAGEHVCHTPPACETCDGMNWCSSGTCPVYCAMDEVMCHDSMTMTDSCHPKSTGCPVTCAAGEHVCHSPPPCETCDGYSWCSSMTCPITCGMNEVLCHDAATMTDTCHPMSTGCPV